MKHSITLLVAFSMSLYLLLVSCGPDDNLSVIPSIEFLGLSKDTMVQSFFNIDTVQLAISFEDGDGDIGNLENSNKVTVFLEDIRTGELYDRFVLPAIPTNGALKGEMFIRVFTTCCVFPDNISPCEAPEQYPTNDLQLKITLFDRAGNKSNIITTPTITLLCN